VTTPTQPPARVRVTSSRRRAIRHLDRPVAEELTEQTRLGDVYVAGLMRAQLRLSASVLLVAALLLGAVPLALAIWPELRLLRIGPLPVLWLVLGVAVYPAAVIGARYYTRASENLEATFVDVIDKT
jgi:hypothetical protein